MFRQFGILFAGEYPSSSSMALYGSHGGAADGFLLMILYVGLLCFTIGLLNIFISVISESYMLEVEKARLTFMRERASGCLTFLLRMRVLPFSSLSHHRAVALSLAALLVLALPLTSTIGVFAMMAAVATLNALVFQRQHVEWPTAQRTELEDHYLWVAVLQDATDPASG